jgi:hypothetical protein
LYKDLYSVAQAAQAANAWVVTGGTDSGIMQLVGRMFGEVAIADKQQHTKLIGIVPWKGLHEKQLERIRCGAKDVAEDGTTLPQVDLAKACTAQVDASATEEHGHSDAKPVDDRVCLEPHHSHFLLVEDAEARDPWGSEVALRFAIEREFSLRRRVPRVLLVVQGGLGTLQCAAADHPTTKARAPPLCFRHAHLAYACTRPSSRSQVCV